MLNTRLKKRYAILLLSTALAGAVSGFLHPIIAIRGALLGISLAIGIIFVNTISYKELSSDRQPKWATILLAAVIVGGTGGTIVNLLSMMIVTANEFSPTSSGLATIILSLCYSLTMHIAYARRWQLKFKTGKALVTLIFISLAGALCAFIRYSMYSPFSFFEGIFFSLFTGVPFAALWAIAVILCDPAWSFKRWNNIVGTENSE
jgi:hypothetical protein